MTTAIQKPRNASSLTGLDYSAEATQFPSLPFPVIDVHTHLSGERAVEIYRRAAEQYGIGLTYSMTDPESAESVRRVLGDAVRFIVTPAFRSKDIRHTLSAGFVERIHQLREYGARLVKFWAAPRGRDLGEKAGMADALRIDAPHYQDVMKLTEDLGMAAMVHVGDPDTWFATKYADKERYGSKHEHYERFEAVLDRFSMPFIGAHMGGWPEDLSFLDGLLQRHPNLYLDTSAAKWMIRELSRHPQESVLAFFTRWKGRLLFGSDIVVTDAHLSNDGADDEMARKATGESEAFDLYASRYWARCSSDPATGRLRSQTPIWRWSVPSSSPHSILRSWSADSCPTISSAPCFMMRLTTCWNRCGAADHCGAGDNRHSARICLCHSVTLSPPAVHRRQLPAVGPAVTQPVRDFVQSGRCDQRGKPQQFI